MKRNDKSFVAICTFDQIFRFKRFSRVAPNYPTNNQSRNTYMTVDHGITKQSYTCQN